jgi:toxin ParE1/3/4
MDAVEWKRQAYQDLLRIGERIAKDSPASALKLLNSIRAQVNSLAEHPYIGRAGDVPGTRELVVHSHYIVYYRVIGRGIEVLRIKHSARRRP